MGLSLGFVTDVFFFVVSSYGKCYGLFYCTIGDYISWYDFSFKWSGKVVKDLAMIRDLMRRVCVTVTEIQTWNVAKLFQENVVWLET